MWLWFKLSRTDWNCLEKLTVMCYQYCCKNTMFQIRKRSIPRSPNFCFFFILALKILFYTIKTNQNIEGLDICDYSFLYSAFADDTTLFSKNLKSVMELHNTIDYFSRYSRLNSGISKCEIAGVGVLKGVHMVACYLKPVDLTSGTLKIPGIYLLQNTRDTRDNEL